MRISDWSSDVCSSDLLVAERLGQSFRLDHLAAEALGCLDDDLRLARRAVGLLFHQFVKGADTGLALGLPRVRGLANPFQPLVNGLLRASLSPLFLRPGLGLRLQTRALIDLSEHTPAPAAPTTPTNHTEQ